MLRVIKKIIIVCCTLDGIRTRNLWIRSPMRYPLRHKSLSTDTTHKNIANWACRDLNPDQRIQSPLC